MPSFTAARASFNSSSVENATTSPSESENILESISVFELAHEIVVRIALPSNEGLHDSPEP